MRRSFVLVVGFLLLSPALAVADFYRWLDKDGNEFFTNDKKQIPQEYRDAAVIVRPDDRRVSIVDNPAVSRRSPVAVTEHKDKYGRGEEYWRRKAVNIRLKLRQQESEYDLAVQQLNDQQKSKKPTGNKKKISSLEKKKIKLEREIAESRRLLDVELPDEARRADAYPGWLRE